MKTKIGQKIKELRLKKKMSMEYLGSLVGVSKQSIYRYEENEKKPSASTLLQISKVLEIHPSEFFQNDQIELKIDNVNFREKEALNDLTDVIQERVIAFCKDYLIGLFELKTLMNQEFAFENPLKDLIITSKKDVEKAAKQLRRKWGLGNAPISNITSLIESKGLSVIELEVSREFTGLSGYANDRIPFIVVNKKCSDITRKRFTLLHELGHIVLEFADTLKNEIIEKLCHHFAGAVLLVENTLNIEFGKGRTRISIKELKALKIKYGISILAIIMRAKETGYISVETFWAWWNSYNDLRDNSGDNTNFGEYEGSEHPVLFDNLIVRGIQEQRITWGKAAELKKVKVDYLKKQLNQLQFAMG